MEMFVEGKNGNIKIAEGNAEIKVTSRSSVFPINSIQQVGYIPSNGNNDGTLEIITMHNGNFRLRFMEDKNSDMKNIEIMLSHHNQEQLNKQLVLEKISPRIKNLLKSPMSAIFCHHDELVILKLPDDTFRVTGYVNSQNSYGAMLKTGFKAYVGLEQETINVLGVSLENQAGKNILFGFVVTIVLFFVFYGFYNVWYEQEYEKQLDRYEDTYDRIMDNLGF